MIFIYNHGKIYLIITLYVLPINYNYQLLIKFIFQYILINFYIILYIYNFPNTLIFLKTI